MSSRQALTSFAYALLKIGAIIYLFPIVWENIQDPNITGNIAVSRLVVWGIVYLVVCFIILVISRENFNLFGFLILLFASVYKLIDILISGELTSSVAHYLFIISVCFYFMTKEYRSRRRMISGGF